MSQQQPPFVPVILAGGSGTRFWPRSRKARAKQVLALSGQETMIQQTVQRLRPLANDATFLIITNDLLAVTIQQQLPDVPAERILREPAARNNRSSVPARGGHSCPGRTRGRCLAFFRRTTLCWTTRSLWSACARRSAWPLLAKTSSFWAHRQRVPETGYGYIEEGAAADFGNAAANVHAVRRFTEKPDFAHARKFLSAGNYMWNSGMFLWSAQTLLNAFREHCAPMLPPIEAIADAFGTPGFDRVFAEQYPAVENISIDFAILESRSFKGEGKSNIYCLPADFGWNDLGSWSALHEHYLQHVEDIGNNNVIESSSALQLDASGNYIYAPGLTVALLGVKDLVVVQTEDALLVTTRAHSQEVGRVVKELVKHARHELV